MIIDSFGRIVEGRQTCKLAKLRHNRDAENNAEQIKQLSLAIVSRLDVVQQQLDAFRERLEEARSGLTRLRNKLEAWIFLGRLVLLFLLVWIGAGQYCLLVQGWRLRCTGKEPPPSDPSRGEDQ